MIAIEIGWLVLEALLLCCFAYLGSAQALALAILLLLVPVCTIPFSLYQKKRIVIGVEAAPSQRKREDGLVTIWLENPTWLPVLRLRCDMLTQNQLNGQMQKIRVFTWMLPKQKQACQVHIGSDYCGRLRIWLPQIVFYDCFGLIGIRSKCQAVTHVAVQPDTFEPRVVLVPNPLGSDDSEAYSQERPGADLTETFQIREYTPGDSPKQIHWKLSGKLDRLIVRDPGLPISKNVLVFWERTGEKQDPAIIDTQAEVVISLCRSLVDNGIQFVVGWNDTDRNLCVLHRIREMDEFVGIIPRLLRATGSREGISGAGLLMQTRADALCAHMVYIAQEPQNEVMDMAQHGHVTMLLCGEKMLEGAVRFDAESYIQQLSEIEI